MNWQKQGVAEKHNCRQTLLIILQKSQGKEHRFYTSKDSGDAHVTDRQLTGTLRRRQEGRRFKCTSGALTKWREKKARTGDWWVERLHMASKCKKITSHLTRSRRPLTLCLCQLRWPLALSRSLTWWPRVPCHLKSPLWTLRWWTDSEQRNVTSLITVVQYASYSTFSNICEPCHILPIQYPHKYFSFARQEWCSYALHADGRKSSLSLVY